MQGKYIDAGGCRTYYLDEGKGPAIVLMHGAGATSDAYGAWFRTIPALARSFRVIAFDQIGFGRSDMTKDGRYLNRLERVDHALAFLDALGIDKAILLGHSEGAFMAARMAIVRPSLASKLVLVTTGGTAPRLGGDADRGWMEASSHAYDFRALTENEEAYIGGNSRLGKLQDAEYEAIVRDAYRRAAARNQLEIFRNLPEAETDFLKYVELQEKHIHPHVASLTMPTLLVWATEDRTVPVERGLALMRLLPNADLHVLSRASHMVMLDRTDDFNRLLLAWCGSKNDPAP
ncbi:MAG: alpha/beta hydrolase [Rhodospirillaceae bacterium]|nr:alpha/beta hydrolase [Rhodospirillaceae bacterium]